MTSDPTLAAVLAHEASLGFWRALREWRQGRGEDEASPLSGLLAPVIERVLQVEVALELEPRSMAQLPARRAWPGFVAEVGPAQAEQALARLAEPMARFLEAYQAARRGGEPELELVSALRDVVATYNSVVALPARAPG